ncbi:hypothetical protein [Nonomuraea jiangxiensis]|uniref:hypothetical protein n=1 Tax=Nonomuraea jiangxiensis TaxID=633440 RepID=UPI000B837E1B|nr:hypothetical protein [Nonomuraea jiangxiensis]
MNQILPIAGAIKGSRCPKTALTSDGQTLAATDQATGHSVRVTPTRLYHYNYDQQVTIANSKQKRHSSQGVAALDADGLVLLDLPGEWHASHLKDFAHQAGIPLEDARAEPSVNVRRVLAARAPGWQRLRGLSASSLRKWQKPMVIFAGVTGAALMVYLTSLGIWGAWRGLSAIGHVVLDLLDAKWLAVAFSPLLLVIRPVTTRLHRRRVKKGTALSSTGGLYLSTKPNNKLLVNHGNEVLAELRIGEAPGQAFRLLLYRYDGLTGLFILDRTGRSLHHLPGLWPPEDANRFATRHNLSLSAHRLTRDEYLTFLNSTQEATP